MENIETDTQMEIEEHKREKKKGKNTKRAWLFI